MGPLFGPAGNGDGFAGAGGKSVLDAPDYVKSLGLDAYEYQGGHGIRISEERARTLGKAAKDAGVALSVHSPYYISMASPDEEKRKNSVGYILASARAARNMSAERIVVHCGSCSTMPRREALSLAKDTFAGALAALDEEELSDITLCPETMGKINQLGTLEEVLEICGIDKRLVPCIDFGHLNARSFGGLTTEDDYERILTAVGDALGEDRLRRFHSHFSKIEYTRPGGEKRHLTFADTVYGPPFEPLAKIVYKLGCAPVFICESSGTQDADACTMKRIYQKTAEGEC